MVPSSRLSVNGVVTVQTAVDAIRAESEKRERELFKIHQVGSKCQQDEMALPMLTGQPDAVRQGNMTVSGGHYGRTPCFETIAPPSILQSRTIVGLLHFQRRERALVSSEEHVMMSKLTREGKCGYLFLSTQGVGATSQSNY